MEGGRFGRPASPTVYLFVLAINEADAVCLLEATLTTVRVLFNQSMLAPQTDGLASRELFDGVRAAYRTCNLSVAQ